MVGDVEGHVDVPAARTEEELNSAARLHVREVEWVTRVVCICSRRGREERAPLPVDFNR